MIMGVCVFNGYIFMVLIMEPWNMVMDHLFMCELVYLIYDVFCVYNSLIFVYLHDLALVILTWGICDYRLN